MKKYNLEVLFTLAEPNKDDVIIDKLYKIGCNDGLIHQMYGIYGVIFSRKAESFEDAIKFAIEKIKFTNIKLKIHRIDINN